MVRRRLLERQPRSKVVMVVPQVVLSTQQAARFIDAGIAATQAFNSEHSLTAASWPAELARCSVMVMTAQVYLNVLQRLGADALCRQVQLLILDECHHTVKGHPYNALMDYYKQGPTCTTQVQFTSCGCIGCRPYLIWTPAHGPRDYVYK